ncbi:SRPBCC family protein [Neptunicella sp. SCSIO 80796]|uniref:SRPBCC family protein n=1 Tax=Neptunicella plasticusilytica TaxID=3117012 RepID=UPI003A4D72A6
MQDMIKREIMINASKEKIYAAIANPELVTKWFPETLEGEYSPGHQPVFGFGEHCTSRIYVVDAKPYDYFAYRWVPGADSFVGDVLSVPNTLVEFQIAQESADLCKITLIESGFTQLPAEVMESAIMQNIKGWDFMLDRLENYIKAA